MHNKDDLQNILTTYFPNLSIDHIQITEDGKVLHRDQIATLSYEEKKLLGQEIGNFLADLHQIPTNTVSQLPEPDQITYYADELQKLQDTCFQLLTQNTQDTITAMYTNYFTQVQHYPPQHSIIHYDFGHDHVYVEGGHVVGVLDWGMVRLGDPALDFRWRDGPRSFDNDIFTEALKTYRKRHPIDIAFLERLEFYNTKKPLNHLLRAIKHQENVPDAIARVEAIL